MSANPIRLVGARLIAPPLVLIARRRLALELPSGEFPEPFRRLLAEVSRSKAVAATAAFLANGFLAERWMRVL